MAYDEIVATQLQDRRVLKKASKDDRSSFEYAGFHNMRVTQWFDTRRMQ
jgi:hypothetical protein